MKIQEELIEQRRLIKLVPKEKLVKMLSSLYTYNHGDKVCSPEEYTRKEGNIEASSILSYGGAFEKFADELNDIGYFIVKTVFEDYSKKTKKEQIEFRKRLSFDLFMPKDIKKFILMDEEYNVVSLFETPATLEFLAKNGDERAKETYKKFDGYIKTESVKTLMKKQIP